MKYFVTLFFLLFNTGYCFGQKTIHPTEKNINPEDGVSETISYSDTNFSHDPAIDKLRKRLINHNSLFTIGKRHGNSYEMLGNVTGAHIDNRNSRIFILDSQDVGIKIFNMEGKYMQQLSRSGRGPGELVYPSSIKIYDNEIYVLDIRKNIKVFSNSNPKFEYIRTINTESLPESFCFTEKKLFVKSTSVTDPSSLKNQDSIFGFEINNYEKPVAKFGELYESESWHAVMQISLGGMECTSQPATVVQYFNYLNLIP